MPGGDRSEVAACLRTVGRKEELGAESDPFGFSWGEVDAELADEGLREENS